jgi:hypothetical protein
MTQVTPHTAGGPVHTIDNARLSTGEPTKRLAAAADRMYRAECALHDARQARNDAWVAAAYDRLHEAILEHSAAATPAGPAPRAA